ncbi:MAG: hypothetical protein FWE08_04885 [Oscillospiraceae bacterium]|nr:hypothetical protein [Oscillospiraceae bacterium]
MKKKITLPVFFIVILILFGCTANENETIIENGSNYRIIETDEYSVLRYEIFNNNGEIIRSGTGQRIPSFRSISEDVLEVSVGAGTGTQTVQFYSAKNDIFSEVFDTPIVITNELIGLVRWSDDGVLNLVVRDIFDTENYYSEFWLKDFSSVANPINALIQVEYLGMGRVEITYLSGKNFVETTTILTL